MDLQQEYSVKRGAAFSSEFQNIIFNFPEALMANLTAARNFNNGFETVEYTVCALVERDAAYTAGACSGRKGDHPFVGD